MWSESWQREIASVDSAEVNSPHEQRACWTQQTPAACVCVLTGGLSNLSQSPTKYMSTRLKSAEPSWEPDCDWSDFWFPTVDFWWAELMSNSADVSKNPDHRGHVSNGVCVETILVTDKTSQVWVWGWKNKIKTHILLHHSWPTWYLCSIVLSVFCLCKVS